MTNFPHKVGSTYRIMMKKAFNEDIDETWIEWALEMIQAGYDSDNLYILAGITRPYYQFELQRLTDKVLADLNLNYENKLLMIRDYIYYIIATAINKPSKYLSTLKDIKDICIALDMEQEYMDFYLLYFAKDDLNKSEVEWYWDGADSTNIDRIIEEVFESYLNSDNSK